MDAERHKTKHIPKYLHTPHRWLPESRITPNQRYECHWHSPDYAEERGRVFDVLYRLSMDLCLSFETGCPMQGLRNPRFSAYSASSAILTTHMP